jgi:signal transduction histidine kinase
MKPTRVTGDICYLCPVEHQGTKDTFHEPDDFTYLLKREDLKILQNNICLAVGTATTVIQFLPNENNHWDRIDSPQTAIAMRMSCYTLRTCAYNGANICKKCDEKHAALFYNLEKQNIRQQLQKTLDKQITYLRKEFSSENHQPEILEKDGRVYLAYSCPMLGYREHVFPIFYNNKVIAVLIFGQIKIETEDNIFIDQIYRTKISYFENNPEIFDYYAKKKSEADKKGEKFKNITTNIMDYILQANKKELQPKYMPLEPIVDDISNPFIRDTITHDEYKVVLERVVKQLNLFEGHIKQLSQEKRERYIRSRVDYHIRSFRSNDLTREYDDLHSMWANLESALTKIAEDLDLEGVAVFGSYSISQKNDKKLRIVCGYGSLNKQTIIYDESRYFTLGFLNGKNRRPINSVENETLYQYLPKAFQKNTERKYCLCLPANRLASASIAVLFDFHSKEGKTLVAQSLEHALISILTSISSRLAELFENATQQYLEKVLRMYKHEITHLTSGMILPIEYLGKKELKLLDDEKIENVYKDACDTLDMVGFIADNIEALLNDDFTPEKQEFNIFKLLLYKWENIFRKDAQNRCIDFSFRKTMLDIYSDPRFIELVVYNLFSNAVKYAFHGSKIYFDCIRDSNTGNVILTTSNYSTDIPQDILDELFEFGVSFQGSKRQHVTGSGIGLFIARQIIRKLGGSIRIKPLRFISAFHVPMLHAFIKRNEFSSSPKRQEAQDAYHRLEVMKIKDIFGKEVNGLDLVIAEDFHTKSYKKANEKDVLLWLNTPTYEIQFEVIL